MGSILGQNATPAVNFFFDDTGNSQFMSGPYTLPAGGGTVTDLWVYVGGDGAAVTGQLCVWNWNTGALVIQSGNITFPAGTRANGGQSWLHYVVPSTYLAAATYGIGFWSSGNVVWTSETTTPNTIDFQHSVANNPTTMAPTGTEAFGPLGGYIVYNPGALQVYNGSAWADGTVAEIYNGSAWVQCPPQIYNGSAWVPTT